MAGDNSFDIVSDVNMMEVSNAVQQAMKEIRQRFDFKGSVSDIALEKEILSVFPRELLVTPDDVKGSAPTLRTAVTTTGWPTLGAARGRVLFYLDRSDAYRDAYTHGRKDLDGRLMFADADESDPFAAVLVRNGALSDRAKIEALVISCPRM